MIYLSNTSVQNGCLRVIPGSHRCQHRLHSLPVAHEQSLSHIEDPDDIAYQSDESEAAVEVTAGDVVLIDPRLLHSAYANNSESERSLITLWYLPEFESLPEPVQARYVQIFNRHELDTGDNAAGKLLDGWPEKHRRAIEDLEPTYHGRVEPHAWNRAPDQSQMLTSLNELASIDAQ
jgi:ectoine hydroxylase-related dioxygenase (phytanoyl-CoA dioxygenase family)